MTRQEQTPLHPSRTPKPSRFRSRMCLLPLFAATLGCVGCAKPRVRTVYTEHLGQLTGTVLNPSRQVGITGTDLGVSFVEPVTGRLIFLFGDSWTPDGRRINQDSAAWAQSFIIPSKDRMTKLIWFAADEFTQIKFHDVDLGGMNVPVEGVPADGRIYVFASTGFNDETQVHCCSALAHTQGLAPEFDALVVDKVVPTDKFVNISAFAENDTVWIFGSGSYRKSSVYLAKVAATAIADRDAWQYFAGRQSNGAPVFKTGEYNAQPVIVSVCVGELSVRKHPQLGYLMLYNCGPEGTAPRGIHLRTAKNPWGPWDPPITIFNPATDRGYGYFMHRPASAVGYDDGLAEPGIQRNLQMKECPGDTWREECSGGEYGPYLVPQWFTTTRDGGYSIIYTMSSWVPYQAHLMRTVLAKRRNPRPQAPPPAGVGLPPAHLDNPNFEQGLQDWHGLGDAFVTFRGDDGRFRMTTFTPDKGDAAMGALFQDFTVDANTKSIRFLVYGGDGTVRLHRGEEIVRETRGRSGHAPRNSPDTVVCWNLADYAGESLRIAIFDDKTGPWGFIGVTGFEFLNRSCSDQ